MGLFKFTATSISLALFLLFSFANEQLSAQADSSGSVFLRSIRLGYGVNRFLPLQPTISELKLAAPGCNEIQQNYSGYSFSRLDASNKKGKSVSSRGTFTNLRMPLVFEFGFNGANATINKHVTLEAGLDFDVFGVCDFYGLHTEDISSGHIYANNGSSIDDYDYDSSYQYRNDFYWKAQTISCNIGAMFHLNTRLPADLCAGVMIGITRGISSNLEVTYVKKQVVSKDGLIASSYVMSTTATTVDSVNTVCKVKIGGTRMFIPVRLACDLVKLGKHAKLGFFMNYLAGLEKLKLGNFTVPRMFIAFELGLAVRF
jgi:hypothetical protein